MKQLLLFVLALVAFTTKAQEFRWVSTIGTTNVDVAQGIRTDTEGNIYVFGTFRGKVDFDPGVGVFELSTNNSGETDPFFMKLDKDSNLIWAKNLRGKSTKTIKNLGIDKQGNVYIIGTFFNQVDFNTSTEVADTFFMTSGEFNGGTTTQSDCFISKYDKDGNFILAKSWGYKKSDFYATESLAIDGENNIYIAGFLTDTLDLGINEAEDLIFPQKGKDGIIYKMNSEGVMLWKKHLPCKGDFHTTGIAVDNDGKSYVSFHFKDTLDLVPGNEAFKIISGDVEGTFKEDIGILKLDSDGTPLWVKTIGGAGVDKAENIMVVNNSELLICGTFTDTVDFDPGVAVNELKGRIIDIFVLKLTKDGDYIWAKNLGGPATESSPRMDIDDRGNIFLSGVFSNQIIKEVGDTLFSIRGRDLFVSKLNSQGNLSWIFNVGSYSSSDPAGFIASGTDGNIYLAGSFSTLQKATTSSPVTPWIFNPANDSMYTWTAAGSSSTSTDIYIASYKDLDPIVLSDTAFYFPFDGNLTDFGGNNVLLEDTLGAGYKVDVQGRIGNALYLDGTQFLTIKQMGLLDPSVTDYTVSAWVKNTAAADHNIENIILHQYNNGDGTGANRYLLALDGNGTTPITVSTFMTGTKSKSTGIIPQDRWIHVAIVATFADTTFKFYIDGELDATVTSNRPFEQSNGGFRIGRHISGDIAKNFTGYIDDLYLIRKALDDDGVKKLMKVSSTAPISQKHLQNAGIYPNPVSETLYFNNAEMVKQIEVYSLTGRKMLTVANPVSVNVSTLAPGTYLVRLILNNNSVLNQKLLVK
jgi:hypothetical protein